MPYLFPSYLSFIRECEQNVNRTTLSYYLFLVKACTSPGMWSVWSQDRRFLGDCPNHGVRQKWVILKGYEMNCMSILHINN